MTFADIGGEGVQDGSYIAYVIYEQPLIVSFTVSSSTVAYYSLIRFVCSFDFRSFFNLSISNRLISSVINESFNSSKPFFSSKQVDTLDMEASQEQGERKKETKLRNYPTLYLCTLKYRFGLF